MQNKTKSLSAIVVIILAIAALIYSKYIPFDDYINKNIETFNQIGKASTAMTGYIQPQVVDGFTEQPIEGAEIVIPETGQRFSTNSQGLTPNIKVPIVEDTHFARIYPKTWGEITLIVYKKNYIEYVLLHTHIWENQSRRGPKILLFKKDDNGESSPMSIIEGPHRLWVEQLVEKYRR